MMKFIQTSMFISTLGATPETKGLWTACLLLADKPHRLYACGLSVIRTFESIERTRGLKTAQDTFKSARWALMKKLVGDPLPKEELLRTRVPFDRYGFPTFLPLPLRQELRTNNPSHETKVFALWLLSIYTAFTGKRKFDFSNITRPSDAMPEVLHEYNKAVPTLLSLLGLTEALDLRKPKLIATNRSGPNGPALLSSHLDAAAWVNQDSSQLQAWLGIWPKAGRELFERIVSLGKLRLSMGPIGAKLALGRIAVKREPMKNRIFAISDYWTQVALKPLHDALMDALASIDQDCTYNQDKGTSVVQKWTEEGRELWSFDLSAATDRFPRKAQAAMLNYLLRSCKGSNLGNIWSQLLTDRAYLYRTTRLRYNAGQPMGSLSSWATFALCHHTIVQWAALKAGHKTRFRDYVLLGDDIVIANGAVAKAYEVLISQLGVSINRSKSIHGPGAEFAKRAFSDGKELTKYLTWQSFSVGSRGPVAFFSLIKELHNREAYQVPWERVLAVVLGPPTNRTVGKGLRNLLLALAEPGGPMECFDLWREASSSIRTVKAWMKLAGGIGVLPTLHGMEEYPEGTEAQTTWADHFQLVHASIRLRKAAGYRLQLQGYEIASLLKEAFESTFSGESGGYQKGTTSIIAGQVLDTEVRLRAGANPIDPVDFHLQGTEKEKLLSFAQVHPAREVLEDGLNPLVYSSVPHQLRVLSVSDSLLLFVLKDDIAHSGDRRNAAIYEVEAEKEMFF